MYMDFVDVACSSMHYLCIRTYNYYVNFVGRSAMKQYLPLKPTKRGFKVWVVAESETGYFLDVQVYVGKEGGEAEHGLGERVVLTLTEQYRGKAHCIYCDDFFSSPALFQALHKHTLYASGTVRQTRKGFPVTLRGTNLQRGESDYRQSGALTAVVWKDKRPVHVLSTLSQPGEMETVSRRQRDGSVSHISCPSAIATYTKYMGGVDRGDKLRKYYSVRLKCNKNYKYIFWFIFDVCVTNAFIISKYYIPSSLASSDVARLKNFRVCLAKSLIGDYNSRKRSRNSSGTAMERPVALPESLHTPHHHPRRRCDYCGVHRNPPRRRESVWQCLRCEGAPTLCLTGRLDGSDCWSLWHAE